MVTRGRRDLTMARQRRGIFSAAAPQYCLDFEIDLDNDRLPAHSAPQSYQTMEGFDRFQHNQYASAPPDADSHANVIPLESANDRVKREIFDLGQSKIEFDEAACKIVESWRYLIASPDAKIAAYAFEVLQDAAKCGNVPEWLPEILFDAYLQTPPYRF